jgi:hypothetical protein
MFSTCWAASRVQFHGGVTGVCGGHNGDQRQNHHGNQQYRAVFISQDCGYFHACVILYD